jgi:hypothetical protein
MHTDGQTQTCTHTHTDGVPDDRGKLRYYRVLPNGGDGFDDVCAVCSDNGPTLFRAMLQFMYCDDNPHGFLHLSDPNHGNANVSKNTSNACGLAEDQEKFGFLNRVATGPESRKAKGRWHGRRVQSYEDMRPKPTT